MGLNNSSDTRVAPYFSQIIKHTNWHEKLLKRACKSINRTCPDVGGLINVSFRIKNKSKEKCLYPPKEYLTWLASNLQNMEVESLNNGNSETDKMRSLLMENDQNTIDLAIHNINKNAKSRNKWWILEGPTYCDVFIETDNYIVVFEGKRTEKHITKGTKWNKNRDQIIRNLDCIKHTYPHKEVIAFYILDKELTMNSNQWKKDLNNYTSKEYFIKSLPHLNEPEITEIMEYYYGIIYWEDIKQWFNIKI